MPSEEEIIEIKSYETQETLGETPVWIIRWGITIFFFIVVFLFIGAWLFKYPDVISAPISITTENPPVAVISKSSGKLSELFVNDSDKVTINQDIAYIDNPALYSDLQVVKHFADSLNKFFINYDLSCLPTDFQTNLVLGDLQASYLALIEVFEDYRDFRTLNTNIHKIRALEQKLEKYLIFYKGLENQFYLKRIENQICKKEYTRDSLLYQQGYISESEYNEVFKIFIRNQYSFENDRNTIISTQITIDELKQNILDLQLDLSQHENQFIHKLKSSYNNLLNGLALFEHMYLIRSPIDGIVTFTNIWSSSHNVTIGEKVFTVIPSYPKKIIGKMQLPILNSGKVKTGQKVIIKLDNYPYKEYGIILGIVKSISLIPDDDIYYIEIFLPNRLNTNYNRKISNVQELKGKGEIITEDMRLIERLVQPIHYLYKRNKIQ